MANENPDIACPQEELYDYSRWMLLSEEEHFALVQEVMIAPKYTVRKDRLPFDGVKIKTYAEIVEERTRESRIGLEAERRQKEFEEALRRQREEEMLREIQQNEHLAQIIKALGLYAEEKQREARAKTDHTLFHIEKAGVCKASGYLNGDGTFVIKKNSKFNPSAKTSFLASAIGASRQHFIKINCIQRRDDHNIIWCTTITDAHCKSAKVAASYMMGAEVDADLWIDEHGDSIVSYYPQLATSKQEYFFYTTADGFVSKGYYDKLSKSFVVCKGSQFLDTRNGVPLRKPMGLKRELFIKKNCDFKHNHYILKRDTTFLSSSEAISCITGEKTFSGPVMWKNEEGKVLAVIFPEIE